MIALALLAALAVGWAAEPESPDPAAPDPADGPAPEPEPPARDPVRRLSSPDEVLRRGVISVPQRSLDEPPPAGPPGWEALEGGAEVPPPSPEDRATVELTVWGRAAILRARERVEARMGELGWRKRGTRPDGTSVFVGPEAWMGSALISPDGSMRFRRRVVWATPQRTVAGPQTSAIPYADRVVRTGEVDQVTTGGLHGPASRHKLRGPRARVRQGVEPELVALRVAIAETAIRDVLAALPLRLERLWAEGEPLAGTALLATPEERRAAIVAYWASRPATPEGRLAQRAVVDFVVEVVQRGPHPMTAEELVAAHARAPDAPRLDGIGP
jgi:hypothetical protein